MKKYKNQRGAISLFVLLSMLFFLVFIMGVFTLVSRRNATQIEALKETQAIYKSGASANDIYDSIMSTSDSAIPIFNKEQLLKAIEVQNASEDNKTSYIIDGKLYTYKKGASYALQNDIILNLEEEINGKNNIDIYDYVLYTDSYNINTNGHYIYYAQSDGSLWKCICYQNIGENEKNSNLFSAKKEDENGNKNANYYGESYSKNLYSILENNSINNYKKMWDKETANFEFMLMYNYYDEKFDSSKYNRWRQDNNPIKETESFTIGDVVVENPITEAKGFTFNFTGGKIGLGFEENTEMKFGGLVKSNPGNETVNTYLDGTVGNLNCFYAVATTKWYTSNDGESQGIPVSTLQSGVYAATECLLFVRVK